jgi:hypothetical protein
MHRVGAAPAPSPQTDGNWFAARGIIQPMLAFVQRVEAASGRLKAPDASGARKGRRMRDESHAFKGSPVRSLPRPNRVWSEGRVCAAEGCITKLSIYNRSKYCWAHEPLHYYIARGRKRRPQAA